MQTKPVTDYNRPKLPTHAILDEHPELLRLIPKRWQHSPIVLTALAGLCAVASSARAMASDQKQTAASRVAPIFQHGEGHAGFGCIAVNPPVVLSEDEACQVIVEEAKLGGVELSVPDHRLSGVMLPVVSQYARRDLLQKKGEWVMPKVGARKGALGLDGWDPKRHIGFEFVSIKDFDKWHTDDLSNLVIGTASEYDLLGTAKALNGGIEKARAQGTYAVFYDPLIGWLDADKVINPGPSYTEPADWAAEGAKVSAQAKNMAREQLRAQVRDFIKWLKAQGVI